MLFSEFIFLICVTPSEDRPKQFTRRLRRIQIKKMKLLPFVGKSFIYPRSFYRLTGGDRSASDRIELFLPKYAVKPQVRKLFLYAVRAKAVIQILKINEIEVLILVKAREDEELLACMRINVPLQALRTDLFHHALHRAVYGSDRNVILF